MLLMLEEVSGLRDAGSNPGELCTFVVISSARIAPLVLHGTAYGANRDLSTVHGLVPVLTCHRSSGVKLGVINGVRVRHT